MSDIEFEKELKVIDLVVLGDAGAWFKVDSQLAKMAALGLEQLNAVSAGRF